MDRLRRRLDVARRALATLEELTVIAVPTKIERDASIQRFEYTVEACWKAAQAAVQAQFGLDVMSPKPVIRACAQNGLLSDEDARAALSMVDDRNLTSHTYNEKLAVALHSRLAEHAALMRRWLTALATVVN